MKKFKNKPEINKSEKQNKNWNDPKVVIKIWSKNVILVQINQVTLFLMSAL